MKSANTRLLENIAKASIQSDASIRQALEAIDRSTLKICFICDPDRRVCGVATDGDIRRALLSGAELSDPIRGYMKTTFFSVLDEADYRAKAHELIQERDVAQVPVLNSEGQIINMVFNTRFYRHEAKNNAVVIMAGGLGSRLRPLTENCPKPLLKLGERPILETIILNFKQQGFYRFYISINYLGHMIRDHLQDGSALGVTIKYIEEKQRLGTAGALTLMKDKPDIPFFVINGDILMQADMSEIIIRHLESQAMATMCIRQYSTRVPYGVVHTDGRFISSVVEKPSHTYFINAGVYCLNPEIIDMIPKDVMYNMTDVFESMLEQGHKAGTYLLDGSWIDVGSVEDYNYACQNLHLLG